jgi:hypothetical protein
MVYTHTTNLFGLVKLFLLKFSVGLIVLEGLICNFLINSGKTPYNSDDGDDSYDADEKTQRGYCKFCVMNVCESAAAHPAFTFSLVVNPPFLAHSR